MGTPTDAGPGAPTLVVDIGGTLVTRDRPGAYHRALRAVAALGGTVDHPGVRERVARHVWTEPDAAAAAHRLAADLRLGDAAAIAHALREPDGEARPVPGAARLLSAAAAHGWRTVAVTNTARPAPELPNEIARLIPVTLCSSDLGVVKQDPLFWSYLRTRYTPDPFRTLVVGDDLAADIRPATAEGFLTWHVNRSGSRTAHVADALEACGPPPTGAVALAGGQHSRWAGQRIVESSHLRPLVARVTALRCRVHAGGRTWCCTLRRRQAGPPALIIEDTETFPALGWLAPIADRRTAQPPRDLAAAMAAARVSLDELPLRERRHLVSLVREAKDPATRTARISHVVDHLVTAATEPEDPR